MKKTIVSSMLIIVLLSGSSFSIDSPDGFASVSGKGLSTTTGGANGKTVIVTAFNDLKKYAESSDPYIILVKGRIEAPNKGDPVNVKSNKTIVGLGNDAILYQIELHIIVQKNIIIRNVTISDSYVEGNYDCKDTDWDGIQADSCHHLWIDHCHFTHNCDGLIDLRHSCDYVTVSWVHLSNHNKAFGIGWTTNTDFRTTIHHCWFDSTNQRNPSFDMGIGHLYNNFVRKVMSYGNLARGEARVVIENSYYENCKNPIQITDNAKCYVSNIVNKNGSGGQTGGNVTLMPFNPKDAYNYTLDTPGQVKDIVTAGCGPKASIGSQYLSTVVRCSAKNIVKSSSMIMIYADSPKRLKVQVTTNGPYTLSIFTSNGSAVEKFRGIAPAILTCAIPGSGVYFAEIHDEQRGEEIRSIIAVQ